MSKKAITILQDRIDREFMPYVRKPGRYIGGEVNQVKKNISDCELTVALCFPDIYEVGMSHTGFMIIYDVLNRLESVAAERVFAPWLEAEQILRDKNIPLFSLESKAAIKDFDIIGFSLTTELCCTNLLNMLDLAGIPVRSGKRGEDHPIILGGGGMANCAEPIAEFVDMFLLGEGEEAAVQLITFIKQQKRLDASKSQILLEAAKNFDFVYVPSLYKFGYEDDKIKSFSPEVSGLPMEFKNAVVEDFENAAAPLHPIVPFVEAIHERVTVEIMRGCPGRCRFCQATFCRRPVRYRSVEKILEIAKAQYHATGFDTVGLLSLSTADYPDLEELLVQLHQYFRDKFVGVSVPSLRVDQQLKIMPKLVTSVRKSGLTIAVEAASEKLRKVINKPITDENLMAGIEAAYEAGFQKVKLYFMVGFPGETDADIINIVNLSYKIAVAARKFDRKTADVTAAVSWLVPKPHTPFGWLGQKPRDYFEHARQLILKRKRELNAKFLQFKFHNIEQSILESTIGRADRRTADIIEAAWRKGAKFDLWDDCFNSGIWEQAFAESGRTVESAAQKSFTPDEILPWQHLGGSKKDYLLSHFTDAITLAERDS